MRDYLTPTSCEIRDQDLGPTRELQALAEVVNEARTRADQLIRDARAGVSEGWVTGAGGSGGIPIQPWDEGLSASGLEVREGMLRYIDSAELVFGVDLREMATGEAPPAAPWHPSAMRQLRSSPLRRLRILPRPG